MTVWLPAQAAYVAVAWYFASRAVSRLFYFCSLLGPELAAVIRDLREGGRSAEVSRLAELLSDTPLVPLLQTDADCVSAEELVATAQSVLADLAPPVRLLRAVATVGTTLGLLASVATLRSGLRLGTAMGMETAASGALDSAVVGFVTALPCWAAISLCQRRTRRAYGELERVVLAMRAGLPVEQQEQQIE